MVSSFY